MNSERPQRDSSSQDSSCFRAADTKMLEWRPGTRVSYAAPFPRLPFWPTVVAISIAAVVGYFASAGRTNYRAIWFLFSALTSGGLTYWWMRLPERTITLDWNSRTLSIKHALIGESLFTTGFRRLLQNPLRSECFGFDDIRDIRIACHRLEKGDPTSSDLYRARLEIDIETAGIFELATGWCDEDEATARENLVPLASWLADVVGTIYQSKDSLDAGATDAVNSPPMNETVQKGEAVSQYDQVDLMVWGIDRFQPGKIVECKEAATPITELLSEGAATAFLVFAGGALLLSALNHRFHFVDQNLEMWICSVVGGLTGIGRAYMRFSPERSILLNWQQQSVTETVGNQQHEVTFDDITGLDLAGQYFPEYTAITDKMGTERVVPARWQTWLDLTLRDGKTLRIANGRERQSNASSDGETTRPSDQSYQELLPIAQELSEALHVSWQWKGFEGHEKYRPSTAKG